MTTDETNWHNTGGDGPASAVWVRKVGAVSVEIRELPYRRMATVFYGREVGADHEGIPFATLRQAKTWGDAKIVRSMVRASNDIPETDKLTMARLLRNHSR